MSFWDRMRKVIGRARDGATDVAQAASIRLDIRNLEGRRDHLFRSIGRRVFVLHEEGRGISEFSAVCEQISEVERTIAARRAELTGRGAEKSDAAAAEARGA